MWHKSNTRNSHEKIPVELKGVVSLLLVSKYFDLVISDGSLFSRLLVRDLSERPLTNSDRTKRVSLVCYRFIEAQGQYGSSPCIYSPEQTRIDRRNNQL